MCAGNVDGPGVQGTAMQLSAGSMLMRRLSFAGSLIGGVADTQEVIDLCAKHQCGPEVEVVPLASINEVGDSPALPALLPALRARGPCVCYADMRSTMTSPPQGPCQTRSQRPSRRQVPLCPRLRQPPVCIERPSATAALYLSIHRQGIALTIATYVEF